MNYVPIALRQLVIDRTQKWHKHFQLDNTTISPLTPEGRVTAIILQFNTPERKLERLPLVNIGHYPI